MNEAKYLLCLPISSFSNLKGTRNHSLYICLSFPPLPSSPLPRDDHCHPRHPPMGQTETKQKKISRHFASPPSPASSPVPHTLTPTRAPASGERCADGTVTHKPVPTLPPPLTLSIKPNQMTRKLSHEHFSCENTA